MVTLGTRGRLDRRESARSKVLRAILLQERDYDQMSKREDITIHQECCPTETKRIHPIRGLSRDGKLLELYRDKWTVQSLYQTTCHRSVVNKPCQLVDPKIRPLSRCVQQFSNVYAFVKDYNTTQHYRLDYVKVQMGCSCEVDFSLRDKR